ncbi:ZZ-type zinc finger-containing protein 3, partial [Exaiptasia diaphana]|uniref:ZZ-type zinc finger-containing protein 3 n=1 Tax=Exaiptasia diaphana TaxID=2652724 RepID=A0A913X2S8_EXADI
MSDDDDDDEEIDPYQRFFFESDYLALKDNKHYHLLLQTLVALEGQRVQAVKDLDALCVEEAKALDDPVGFVEKLQNNEPLGLPSPQNVIKLPKIPWESYASSFGPIDMSLPIQHHTRSSTASNSEKATQELQPAANLLNSEVTDSNTSETIFSEAVKNNIPGKMPTFNQQWTIAEQTRLEKLLQVYPQEDIEAKRWEKIAKALGNRTPKQVASRVQKYFIKLAKAGLPVPGRVPNIPRSGARTAKRSSHYQMMGFRNSTFFPSYQPRVFMSDSKDDDDESSVAFSDDTSYLS